MKKTLFSLACAAMSLSALAASYTIVPNTSGWETGEYTTTDAGGNDVTKQLIKGNFVADDGTVFQGEIRQMGSTTKPEGAKSADLLKWYKGMQLTITAPSGVVMKTIVFNTPTGSSNKKYCVTFALDGETAGTVVADAEAEQPTITWSNAEGVASFVAIADQGQIRANQIFISDEAGDTPEPPAQDTNVILDASFASNDGGFAESIVTMPEELTYVWSWRTQGYWTASAYKSGTAYATEAYLLSPAINLADRKDIVLTFDHCVNKFPDLETAKADVSLWIRTAGATEWAAELPIDNFSDNASWTFVNAGNISLDAYRDKTVELGFRYTSADGASGQWEIKNVKVTVTPDVSSLEEGTLIVPNQPVEYFNLQGMRINHPAQGQVVIRRQGSQVTKIFVR